MALTASENFGTVVPGFVTDDDGRLVVSDAAGSLALANQSRFNQQGGIETLAKRTSTLGNIALTDGVLRIAALESPLLAGVSYTGVDMYSGASPSSGLTHSWVCLFDFTTSKVLRSSANIATEWTASTKRSFVLSAYTPTVDIPYAGIGIVTKASTTLPTVLYLSSAMPNALYSESPRLTATASGYTNPVADDTSVTMSSSGLLFSGTVY